MRHDADRQLNLFEAVANATQAGAVQPRSERPDRPQKLYRWHSEVSRQGERACLHLSGATAAGGDERVQSAAIVSFEVSSLRAVDRLGRRFRLLSPSSLAAIDELMHSLPECGVAVTWHGLPYRAWAVVQ